MIRPDPIEILVAHQAAALVRCGRPIEQAREEAEDIVKVVLEDLFRIGLKDIYLSVALRRSRVYHMRSQGLTALVVSKRLGISIATVKRYYKAEMLRQRQAA